MAERGSGAPVVVFADDLTGSADSGVQFARAGVPARVWLAAAPPASEGVTVYDTDSRALSPAAASARLMAYARPLVGHDGYCVYKKIDSTMRGNVGAETLALLAVLRRPIAVLAPAFPANGRTTRDGVQLVNGVPVHRTAAGRDPAHPMRRRTIAAALRSQGARRIAVVSAERVRRGIPSLLAALAELIREDVPTIAITDAETNEDLATIAGAVAQLGDGCLPVGSAGLAAELALAWGGQLARATSRPLAPARRTIVVCGSLNPATLAQLVGLERHLGQSAIDALAPDATKIAIARLEGGGAAVLASGTFRPDVRAAQVAAMLGEQVARICRATPPEALVLTGGDVARAVLGALGATGIELRDEVLPGLPAGVAVGGAIDGTPVVTKAGGFGPPDGLVRALRYLRRDSDVAIHAT